MNKDVPSQEKLTILLVENSRTARAVMTALLSNSGYTVHPAGTGPEALQVLDSQSVDVVIMDVFMPLMNGYEVTKAIRSSNKPYANIPIIAYTASKNPRDEVQCKEAGMNEYLVKTEDNKPLLSWLKNYSSGSTEQ
ncbi:MAG TPA: response regulator [Gammaproteobacteria bacterium]|nr:response regulator [Gammaproteobacteria bacterium]